MRTGAGERPADVRGRQAEAHRVDPGKAEHCMGRAGAGSDFTVIDEQRWAEWGTGSNVGGRPGRISLKIYLYW
jgi:hypothetical protein